jgi:hypothetical protein
MNLASGGAKRATGVPFFRRLAPRQCCYIAIGRT